MIFIVLFIIAPLIIGYLNLDNLWFLIPLIVAYLRAIYINSPKEGYSVDKFDKQENSVRTTTLISFAAIAICAFIGKMVFTYI